MADEQHLEQIKELLVDATPNRSIWYQLCDMLVDRVSEDGELDESLLATIDELLVEWPDKLRVTPPVWVEKLLEGEHLSQMVITRSLDLRGQQLVLEDAELLAESPELKWITYLNLAYNGMQDDGTAALVSSDVLCNLQFLDLSGNSIEAQGIHALATCEHLKNLRHLDLTGNWVNDEAASYIADSEHFTKLETLVLRGNPIRTAGAKALANSEHLRESIRNLWIEP